jgi:hypothetical protein
MKPKAIPSLFGLLSKDPTVSGDLYLTFATKYSPITACAALNLAGATHFNAHNVTYFYTLNTASATIFSANHATYFSTLSLAGAACVNILYAIYFSDLNVASKVPKIIATRYLELSDEVPKNLAIGCLST